jgi:hypothetical protein
MTVKDIKFSNSKNVAFTTVTMKNNFSSDLWILDSGASCHYCRSLEGLTDVKEINESIKIGNGDSVIKSFGVKFEFSGPRTPQRNGKFERKFQTLYGRIRSILNGADLEVY